MFWSNIKKELNNLKAIHQGWSNSFALVQHDNICGFKGAFPNGKDFSIISHKFSYGGEKDEFEIMSSHLGDDVVGHLTEEEGIEILKEIANS